MKKRGSRINLEIHHSKVFRSVKLIGFTSHQIKFKKSEKQIKKQCPTLFSFTNQVHHIYSKSSTKQD